MLSGPAIAEVTNGPENLALRAAHALLEHESRADGVRIALHKQIPTGAGLGGGSADAAVVLVALDRILELGMTPDELARPTIPGRSPRAPGRPRSRYNHHGEATPVSSLLMKERGSDLTGGGTSWRRRRRPRRQRPCVA